MRGGLIAAACLVVGCASDLGPPCSVDADCAGGEVCGYPGEEVEDQEALPLRCRPRGETTGESCTRADDCVTGVCVLGGSCARACVEHIDCEGDETCRRVYARGIDDHHLHPTTACVREVVLPAGVDVVRSKVEGGLTSTDRVTLPGTTSGSATYAVVPIDRSFSDAFIPTGVLRLDTIPDGTSLLDPEDGLSIGVNANGAVFSFEIPFGYERAYSPDGYVAELLSFGSPVGDGYERVTAELIRTSRSEPGRTLDLDVFLFSGDANARTIDRFEAARGDMQAVLDQADIELGSVRYHPVGGALRERYQTLTSGLLGSSTTQQGELMRLSRGVARPSVAVFVVDELMDFAGEALEGVSCGIPGPQGIHGTDASGVVITWGATFDLAHVLVHELGHFLGLRHTTERYGTPFDGFADTPECPIERDADGDGQVDAAECADAGADNLMFWREGGTRITASQAQVLQSSPLLY